MTSNIARYRHRAYLTQSGRCYYCDCLMWEDNLPSFSEAHNLPPNRAKRLQCTAEHLVARQDGGRDSPDNIVAACLFCNRARHRIANAPSPTKFRERVQTRLRKGQWNTALWARPPENAAEKLPTEGESMPILRQHREQIKKKSR